MSAEREMFKISFDFSTMHHVVNKVCYYSLGWQARPPFCKHIAYASKLKAHFFGNESFSRSSRLWQRWKVRLLRVRGQTFVSIRLFCLLVCVRIGLDGVPSASRREQGVHLPTHQGGRELNFVPVFYYTPTPYSFIALLSCKTSPSNSSKKIVLSLVYS